ncbi:gas vesicle protein [Streptomyces sp. NPDC051219]|uniref:gas vesicle protein n=1 Tax=Streptomyces sp. NPDC051219 TaxID=3155283 RepID=UPI00342B0154
MTADFSLSGPAESRSPDRGSLPDRQIALIDLLDRLLTGGIVITGDVTLSIADIDLVRISLRALIASIGADTPSPWNRGGPGPVTSPGHRDQFRSP